MDTEIDSTITNSSAFLFKKVKPVKNTSPFASLFQDDKIKDETEEKELLSFVGEVKNGKELANMIRQDPLGKYLLFKGQMVDIKISIPVFIDGKNVETTDSEWF